MENLGLNIDILQKIAMLQHQDALKQAETQRLLRSVQAGQPYLSDLTHRQPKRRWQWFKQRTVQTA